MLQPGSAGVSGRVLRNQAYPCAIAVVASFLAGAPVRAEETEASLSSLATQSALTDTPGGPREKLREIGLSTDFWITQILQGQPSGSASKDWLHGGRFDALLKVDGKKLGLWEGFRLDSQFEHYLGRDINSRDFALLPVNSVNAFVRRDGYHSALSIAATQDFGEHFSIAAGKVNTMTLAARTPLLGGGGIDTFLNRAFAAPATGVGVAARGTVTDRLVVSPTYTLGAAATLKSDPLTVTFLVVDPRNAQNSRVIEHPFERGVSVGGMATIKTKFAGEPSFHTFRAVYSNARGFDLDDAGDVRRQLLAGQPVTKKGYWFASYGFQQFLAHSEKEKGVGWGGFGLVNVSDGNPNPVKWSVIGGLAGNNLLPGRELDRWGLGYFHYGLSQLLIDGLARFAIRRRSESGFEAFYNLALTPWLRLSADVQYVDPWNTTRARACYAALRLQTKF